MRVFTSLFLILFLGAGQLQASPSAEEIVDQLRQQVGLLEVAAASHTDTSLHAAELVARFYRERSHAPVWLDEDGLQPRTRELVLTIQRADDEGMNPSDYHFDLIRSMLIDLVKEKGWQDGDAPMLARLEILCTDAFLTYAAHLTYGRFNPTTVYKLWQMPEDNVDPVALLNEAIASGQVGLSLHNLAPRHPVYAQLKGHLDRYRRIANEGGWSMIEGEEKLEAGDKGPRVLQLRDRLFITGELSAFSGSDLFDDELTLAVIRFQATHGLGMDGVAGKKTLAALNVPVEERIHQIELNLERWRWLPRQLGERYIHVNITDFSLSVIEQDKTALSMPVIVGRASRSTPSFSANMTYIVANPYWTVPKKIAVLDKLPLIKKDPNYLTEHNFRVYRWSNGEPVELNPYSIDWNRVNRSNFNYSLRQEPGPENALGLLKFMFPNKFDIYLHDTPTRHLFEQEKRTFSSGCIRVSSPIELANYLLKEDPAWGPQSIVSTVALGANEIIHLAKPIPVYVLYWTAWVGEDGRMQFRDDIYDRDAVLTAAESVTNVTDLIALSSSNQPIN